MTRLIILSFMVTAFYFYRLSFLFMHQFMKPYAMPFSKYNKLREIVKPGERVPLDMINPVVVPGPLAYSIERDPDAELVSIDID